MVLDFPSIPIYHILVQRSTRQDIGSKNSEDKSDNESAEEVADGSKVLSAENEMSTDLLESLEGTDIKNEFIDSANSRLLNSVCLWCQTLASSV